MQQTSSYTTKLWGGLGCSLMVLLLGGWLLPKQPASSMASDWFWTQKAHPKQQYEVVVVGDSRIYRGFSPEDFNQGLATEKEKHILNFGFSSAGLDTAFLRQAAHHLDTAIKQPLLLLGITTSSLADENAVNQHFWQEYKRTGYERWQRQYLNPYLGFFDPSSPNALRQHFQEEQQGYFQTYYDNGWVASDKRPHTPWESYDHVRRTYPNVEFSLGFRQRLIQQVAAWQRKGIQVVAFRPPAAPHLEELEMRPNYYPEKAIQAQIEAVGGIWLSLPEGKEYTTYDGNHLVEESARAWSKDLGELLREKLDARARRRRVWRAQQDFEEGKLSTIIEDQDAPVGRHVQSVSAGQFSFTHAPFLWHQPEGSLQFTASGWVRFPQPPQGAVTLVISVEHPLGEVYLWQGVPVLEQVLEPSAWSRVHFSIPYLNNLHDPDDPRVLKAYIWNNSQQPLLLDGFTLEIETHEGN